MANGKWQMAKGKWQMAKQRGFTSAICHVPFTIQAAICHSGRLGLAVIPAA
jgi:hypothetical protein